MAVEDSGTKGSHGGDGGTTSVTSSSSKAASAAGKTIPVRVAVRVRPVGKREQQQFITTSLLQVAHDHPQISIGNDENKTFTFDYVFSPEAGQEEVYNKAVARVVHQLYKGFNVTILAYGQTGSGKTYSMGTNHVVGCDSEEQMGIIPRAVTDIFTTISEKKEETEFQVKVSFIELYNDYLYDLLQTGSREESTVEIRETGTGEIKVQGLTEISVTTLSETMSCLEQGSRNRATGATCMNAVSSRSHAMFCVHLQQRKKGESEGEAVCAKFTMVDLAGSERAKKTGATGNRLREGININQGLLSLGNVIKALAEKNKFVPYRDGKLTRLLQDSLGGNSHTVMLACVSPADDSVEETLNTLRYADRAKKIKNKPIVNSDPKAAELAKLRQQVQQLQVELISARATGGCRPTTSPQDDQELSSLMESNTLLKEENEKIMMALQAALEENASMAEKALMAEMSRDRLKQQLDELRAETGVTVDALNKTLNASVFDPASTSMFHDQLNVVKSLEKKIIDMQSEQNQCEKALVALELTRHNAGTNTSFAASDDEEAGNEDNSTACGDREANSTKPVAAAAGAEGGDSSIAPAITNTTVAACAASPEPAANSPATRAIGVAYALNQAKLTDSLASLNRVLAQKEELKGKLQDNGENIHKIRAEYERAIKEMEAQIAAVLKEKLELQEQLDKAPKNVVNKISEQRRQRVQELTAQIEDLRNKVKDKSKMIKLKEASEKKVTLLNNEIASMKQMRVKLIRQMKEDSEKFRSFSKQKEQQIAKLKEQDRRKEFQLVKMERLNNKQMNVLKRKVEQASAINKRLKDAITLQKACADKRANSSRAAGAGSGPEAGTPLSRVRSWLDGELEVVAVKKQAKISLQALREDRKTISDQLRKVQRDLQSRDQLSVEYCQELEGRQKELQDELQLRSAQIADIQHKCLDDTSEDTATGELLNRKRFASVMNIVEAKVALGYLFETAAQHMADSAVKQQEVADLQSQLKELGRSSEELEGELEQLKRKHRQDVTKMERECEDKVLYFLREMGASDGEPPKTSTPVSAAATVPLSEHQQLKQRLAMQTAEIRKLSKLHEQLQQKVLECDELQRALEDEKNKKSTNPAITLLPPKPDPTVAKPALKKVVRMSVVGGESYDHLSDEFSSGDEDDDDDDKDPDWKKTPLFKRIRSMKRRRHQDDMAASDDEKENLTNTLMSTFTSTVDSSGMKRNSDGGVKCGCSSDCTTKRCSCRKSGGVCSIACRCNAMKCANKSTPDTSLAAASSADNSKNTDALNSTFDVNQQQMPAPTQAKKAKLSRETSDSSLHSTSAVNGSCSSNSTLKDLNTTFLKPRIPPIMPESPQLF